MAHCTRGYDGSTDGIVTSSLFTEVSDLRKRDNRDITASGFVVVNSSGGFWMDLFIRYFLCTENPDHHDDLVFFVKKATRKSAARYFPRVEVRLSVKAVKGAPMNTYTNNRTVCSTD